MQAAGFIPPLKLYEGSWFLAVMFAWSVLWLVSKERRPAAAACQRDLPLAQELQAGGFGCDEPGFQFQSHRAWLFCSLIYYPGPAWRVLFYVCLSHDIVQCDTTGQFWTEKVEPSTCQVLFSQWRDFSSTKAECVCRSRQCMHDPHTCIIHTPRCFTPSSQSTRIIQTSTQHSAAIIQIANTEEKAGF